MRTVLLITFLTPLSLVAWQDSKATPVVIFNPWRDPNEGAFALNVPQGWRLSGGASRRAAVDYRMVVRAGSTDGRIQIFLDDPNIVPRQVPDALSTRMGIREGQVIQAAWGGPLMYQRFRTGMEYSRDYAGHQVCPQAQFTGGGELQQETADMNRQAAPYASQAGMQSQASAGDAYFVCGTDFGYVATTTLQARPARGAGVTGWYVMQLGGFMVKDEVDVPLAMYVLHTMLASFKLDPQWEDRNNREAGNLTSAVTHMQNALANSLQQQSSARASQERSSVVSRNKPYDVMSGWEARNKVRDGALDRSAEARRGTTITQDPVWGNRTVSNDSNYMWTRPDGSIIGTNTDVPPQVAGGGWRLMTRQ